jgi:putative nucleotidyltransferase with HDIG domain
MFSSIKKRSRLGQWDGRKRSSRNEEPGLPKLWHLPVLIRLATVLATLLVVTFLAYRSGPPMPYRVGAVYPTDLRVRARFEVVNQPLTDRARAAAIQQLPTEEVSDPAARERAARAVPPVVDEYKEGVPLVRHGQPITDAQLNLLKDEHRAYLRSQSPADHARRYISLFLIMSQLALVAVLYGVRFQQALAQSLAKVAGVCALVILTVALALLLSGPPWYAVLLPLTVTAMILTIAYNPQFALLMSFCLSLATTVALAAELDGLLIQMSGLATAVLLLRNVRTRTGLVQVGIGAGFAYLAMTVATSILSAQPWRLIFWEGGRNFAWGALAGFLLTGSLPLVERCFGIITDVRLLELGDGSHPLLQELIRRAPGTYTHSMTVATLAEAAAEAIGANPLLARVGSYFHDVGKMLKPHYFIENQTGENHHDSLEPALSTLVIIGHVKDGLALARQYDLPRPITDFIEQHHGTTLVEYFYREALRLQENQGQGNAELEASFRYPGPKPRNRENGIVMLADAVESTSRALKEPAPSSLRKVVHDLLMKRLLDGQFEESGLTLTELHLIEESLAASLAALYHGRIKYPDECSSGATLGMRRAS